MPVCSYIGCVSGPTGKRYGGNAQDVHEHEMAVHGKQRTTLGVTSRARQVPIMLPPKPEAERIITEYMGESIAGRARTKFGKQIDQRYRYHLIGGMVRTGPRKR